MCLERQAPAFTGTPALSTGVTGSEGRGGGSTAAQGTLESVKSRRERVKAIVWSSKIFSQCSGNEDCDDKPSTVTGMSALSNEVKGSEERWDVSTAAPAGTLASV